MKQECKKRERHCFLKTHSEWSEKTGWKWPVKTGGIVQSLSHAQLFAIPWTAACQASLSFTICWRLLKLMSIELVMPSNHLILWGPFLLTLIFPSMGSFLMSWLYASGGQNIGASASLSVLPINIQDWFPLGLTVLISLPSKGLPRVFCNTTVQKHQFFCIHLLYGQILTSIHDYWKNHSLD